MVNVMTFVASAQAASSDGISIAVTIIAAAVGAAGVITVGVLNYFTQRKQLREQRELFETQRDEQRKQFERQLDDTRQQLDILREGQLTERYLRAVSQLGDESSPVRVGCVYALERIGNDSPKDRTTIIYTLGAFIRERSMVARERPNVPPEDVKAGVRVVGRLLEKSDAKLDLRDADLRYADLSNLRKDQVMLEGAKLEGSKGPRHV
jgi:hypothetical protein